MNHLQRVWIRNHRELTPPIKCLIERICTFYQEVQPDPLCTCGNCPATQSMGKFIQGALQTLGDVYAKETDWTCYKDLRFSIDCYNLMVAADVIALRCPGFSMGACWYGLAMGLPEFLWRKFAMFEAVTHEN